MRLLPLVTQALHLLGSRPARHRLAARTVLWGVAGLLCATGVVFALIGMHGLLADLVSPVAASFLMALGLVLSAGLLALGAWLAAPPEPRRSAPETEITILLAGFLDGLSGPASDPQAPDKPQGKPSADRDH